MIELVQHKSWTDGVILKRRYGRKTILISPAFDMTSPGLEVKFNKNLLIPDDYEELIETLGRIETKYIEPKKEYINSLGNTTDVVEIEKSELERCILFLISKYSIPFRIGESAYFIDK